MVQNSLISHFLLEVARLQGGGRSDVHVVVVAAVDKDVATTLTSAAIPVSYGDPAGVAKALPVMPSDCNKLPPTEMQRRAKTTLVMADGTAGFVHRVLGAFNATVARSGPTIVT